MSGVSVRPPNSVILVGDAAGDVPETIGGGLVHATATVVAVGTRAEAEGATSIRVVDGRPHEQPSGARAFVGTLRLPSRLLTVESVLGERYVEHRVQSDRVGIEIWANDEREPDEIVVLVG